LDILSIAGRGVFKPFSLRDDSRDGGGRAKSGTGVEKGGDEGKGVRRFHLDRGL
jgi:hypothetical protein